MAIKVIAVRYHDFEPVKQIGNIVLAKCKCHNPPRYTVYRIINSSRQFIYHGYDKAYAEKLFLSLVSKSQVQS